MKCPRDGAEMEMRPGAKSLWRQFRPQDIEVGFCPVCREYHMRKLN